MFGLPVHSWPVLEKLPIGNFAQQRQFRFCSCPLLHDGAVQSTIETLQQLLNQPTEQINDSDQELNATCGVHEALENSAQNAALQARRGQSSGCPHAPCMEIRVSKIMHDFSAGPASQRNVRHQTHRNQMVSWIEWVHTGSNPADALTRPGWESAAQRMSLALKEAERRGRWFQRGHQFQADSGAQRVL